MNHIEENIQRLIDRMMAGETTLAEERLLADFFRSHAEVKPEWADCKLLFDYIGEGMPELPAAPSSPMPAAPRRRRWTGWLVGVPVAAAAVVLAFLLLKPAPAPGDEQKVVAQAEKPLTPPRNPQQATPQPPQPEAENPSEADTQPAEAAPQPAEAPRAVRPASVPSAPSADEVPPSDYEALMEKLMASADPETEREIDEALVRLFQQQREITTELAEQQFDDGIVVEFDPM